MLGLSFYLLSLVFGFIFMTPGKILERLNLDTPTHKYDLVTFTAALVLALLLDMFVRWFLRRACATRTSGSRDDWMA